MAGTVIKVVGTVGVSAMMHSPMARGAKPMSSTFNVVRAADGTVLGQVRLYRALGPYKAQLQWTSPPSKQTMPAPGDLLQTVGKSAFSPPAPPAPAPAAPALAPAPSNLPQAVLTPRAAAPVAPVAKIVKIRKAPATQPVKVRVPTKPKKA